MKFSKIYDLNEQKVYRYLLSLCHDEFLAQELTQETFYKAYQHIRDFQGESSFYTWLCQIARNSYINHQKKKCNSDLELQSTYAVESKELEYSLIEKDQAIRIHKVLHQLNDPYKEVFSLKVFGELKFREIAEIFGKTENWAKVTYYRAKVQIVKEMEETK